MLDRFRKRRSLDIPQPPPLEPMELPEPPVLLRLDVCPKCRQVANGHRHDWKRSPRGGWKHRHQGRLFTGWVCAKPVVLSDPLARLDWWKCPKCHAQPDPKDSTWRLSPNGWTHHHVDLFENAEDVPAEQVAGSLYRAASALMTFLHRYMAENPEESLVDIVCETPELAKVVARHLAAVDHALEWFHA